MNWSHCFVSKSQSYTESLSVKRTFQPTPGLISSTYTEVTRPHQLHAHWGNQEMETAISCEEKQSCLLALFGSHILRYSLACSCIWYTYWYTRRTIVTMFTDGRSCDLRKWFLGRWLSHPEWISKETTVSGQSSYKNDKTLLLILCHNALLILHSPHLHPSHHHPLTHPLVATALHTTTTLFYL